MLMLHQLTLSDIVLLNQLIHDHQTLFLSIEAYSNLHDKPKLHYASHFPLDILIFGPPRHYWCMRFEAMNQVFKKIAKGSNFKDVIKRCAQFWCIKSARDRYYEKHATWGETMLDDGAGQLLTYYRSHSESNPKLVTHLFEAAVSSQEHTLQLVYGTSLSHHGTKYTTDGRTWIQFQLWDTPSRTWTGHLGSDSIFRANGVLYFLVQLFPPLQYYARTGMPYLRVPCTFVAELRLFPLEMMSSLVAYTHVGGDSLPPDSDGGPMVVEYKFVACL
eukprot:457853-Pleurochrysis_carterae.AAC.1